MHCLDEPLHLEILSSLAANLARSPDVQTVNPAQPAVPVDNSISVLLDGLPFTESARGGEGSASSASGDDDEEDSWDEYEINHAISYSQFVSSLPTTSTYTAQSFPRLSSLLRGLLAQGTTPFRGNSHSGSGSGSTSSSASSAPSDGADGNGTALHAELCSALLQAIIWVGWASIDKREEVGHVLDGFFKGIAELFSVGKNLTFPLVLLSSMHATLARCPLPPLPPALLPSTISHVMSIAEPAILLKLVRSSSTPSTPAYAVRHDSFTAPHAVSPGGVVMLVTEIVNIFLASSLQPLLESPSKAFEPHRSLSHGQYGAVEAQSGLETVLAVQTTRLVNEPIGQDAVRLSSLSGGKELLEHGEKTALRWWMEMQGLGDSQDPNEHGRRNSLFTFGGGDHDEEVELSVAVLHLMNIFALHRGETEGAQLARLKLIMSEKSTITDTRILETAFVCTAILVRNYPSLGTSLTHHIRRLLVNPLPASESETVGYGQASPVIKAASKCLAICIECSPNDDLISSTLYSLLNLLSHGVGTTIGTAITHIPPANQFDTKSIKSAFSGSTRKTEDQRRLVAVTAVEIVSRLSLEMKREDIIHLTISMLLQRLRGVDLAIESTIVANLVPLALAASNSDLIEVYRAFSQIARSSHPEDPRMSSNAVLAAQSMLAQGLEKRLDCADGYLTELLILFAEKGTQTQMYAMAPSGFDPRDKEKYVHLKSDSETRVADMKAWLAALLIPISTLLSHPMYHPDHASSPELVAHFRNLWFLCVAFGLSGEAGKKRMSEHEAGALNLIAEKTPAIVLEDATDYVASDLEYNSILRKDFAASIASGQRTALHTLIPGTKYSANIRSMSALQTTLLLAIHDLEDARTARYRPSYILNYFCNESVNSSILVGPLDGIVQKISTSFLRQISKQTVTHSLPSIVGDEVCKILIACTHRYRKVREAALNYARQLIESFAALMCDRKVVFTLLEILTLMRRSCELQYTDEYSPTFEFTSDKMDLTIQLTDDYAVRNEIVSTLHNVARSWLTLAISRAPIEVQSTLQSYLGESRDILLIDNVEMGAGLALHFCKAISTLDRQESVMPKIGGWPADSSNLVASQFANKNYFLGELSGARHVLGQGLANLQKDSPTESSVAELLAFKAQLAEAVAIVRDKTTPFSVPEIRRLLLRSASVLVSSPRMDSDIIHYLVKLPMTAFTPLAIAAGVDAWTWLMRQRPEAEVALMGEISAGWLQTIRAGKGLFSTSMNYSDPFELPIAYSPSDKGVLDLELAKARRLLRPHLLLIQVLSSQFQAIKYREPGIMTSLIRLMMRSLAAARHMSTHPLAREVRFSLLLFGFQMLASSRMEALLELRFRDRLYNAAFTWFSFRPQWSFGSDRVQVGAEIKLLQEFMAATQADHIRGDHSTSSLMDRSPAFLIRGVTSLQDYSTQHRDRVRILHLLLESEITRLSVWSNSANEPNRLSVSGQLERGVSLDEWARLVTKAWKIAPAMAIHMGERFKYPSVQAELTRLVRLDPKAVIDVPEALHFLLGDRLESASRKALQWLPVWAAVPPVTALVYFQPRYGNHPLILQYAMRVLEQHPVELTFFFVPQCVQALRADGLGYVERFIFETSKISQLFCHQIIWNMKANTYKDDDASEPDSMKPLLDRMIDMIVAGLSGKAKAFYDMEFTFFESVTSISGKLRPYIKKTKPEKKAKIDEEMALIDLSIGVYLPSNPDGNVIDLDRKSGRPLQSHAKAPFMATFKVQKERVMLPSSDSVEVTDEAKMVTTKYDVWQSAIFKVGDDCRQDVLALQIIAMFKNVFTSVGLVLYLFPYRVTATAPGCGVIDVVPNATSRDEMGRAKVNDLLSYFIDKYGGVDTIPFQKARLNFIQSMAAYSVACYILQIKDRHNGNIMIDAEGHIVHIDFGFLFDIGPGGIKFEPNSFKLNHEMVALMGGRESQGYKMFAELTIKAFLAIRPHADQLVDAVHLMLGTGLPSFKGEPTIKRLRDRFQLQLDERAAADYMMGVIRNAHENMRSNVYDGFQKIQNGIPY